MNVGLGGEGGNDVNRLDVLQLRAVYRKGQNDIAKEFYLPCMERATQYDRAVGFFSSSIYIIAWSALREFVNRGGKMRLICSPLLSEEDKQALAEGYAARVEEEAARRLVEEIRQIMATPYLEKPARLLASLVAMGIVELKIAYMDNNTESYHRKLFHDKLGIFKDNFGNVVVFKGSMNETYAGLSNDGNLESVDVFVSWGGARDLERVETEVEYFEKLWRNEIPTVRVKDFPDIAKEELYSFADIERWPEILDEIIREMNVAHLLSADRRVSGRTLRPHQARALAEWIARGRRGILEHATGSGKTFTALCAIRNSLEKGEVPVVLVPSKLLMDQWYRELRETLADLGVEVLRCGDGHDHWRQGQALWGFTRPGSRNRIVLATMQTACTALFLSRICQGEHLFVVADEVHRIGSPEHRRILNLVSGPRLGLSATPVRAGDPEGTQAIFSYFGGVVPPPYTIRDAIRDQMLTPYYYRPYRVYLTQEEQEKWDQFTSQIRRLYAIAKARDETNPASDARIKQLLIKRARIVKQASAKVDLALQVVREHFQAGQWWLIYCDNQEQLAAVVKRLREHGYDAYEYHSNMLGDREQTIRYFELHGGILVSIRCLDEGVDIPKVSHALILASSQNPREFIQRRGRVLRKSEGKVLAYIYDAIVLPANLAGDAPPGTAFVEAELARALEFGRHSINPGSIAELQLIAVEAGLDVEKLVCEGMEQDDV